MKSEIFVQNVITGITWCWQVYFGHNFYSLFIYITTGLAFSGISLFL